jgi:hypothetical protein
LKSAIFKYHLRIPQLHPSLLRFFSYPTWQEPWRIFPYVSPLSHLIYALLIGGFKAVFFFKQFSSMEMAWVSMPCFGEADSLHYHPMLDLPAMAA